MELSVDSFTQVYVCRFWLSTIKSFGDTLCASSLNKWLSSMAESDCPALWGNQLSWGSPACAKFTRPLPQGNFPVGSREVEHKMDCVFPQKQDVIQPVGEKVQSKDKWTPNLSAFHLSSKVRERSGGLGLVYDIKQVVNYLD
jgi:hypothetical protein